MVTREHTAARKRKWQLANREKCREINRRWDSAHKEQRRESIRKWHRESGFDRNKRIRYAIQIKARHDLWSAIRSGNVIRPNCCDGCGIKCKPHGHHLDYSKPIEVLWLCESCHREIHL